MIYKSRKTLKILSVLVSMIMIITIINIPSLEAKASGGLDDFVTRCYEIALGRTPEPAGLADWEGQLVEGRSCGSKVVYGIVFSQEYKNRNRSNEEYVEDLYNMFLGRPSDVAGKTDWVGKLDSGMSRQDIFAGFANSQEFYNLCRDYGITAGYFDSNYDYNKVNKVNLFVSRLYRVCLGRLGDQSGQANWTKKLLSGEITGSKCAHDFIFSEEYLNNNLSNGEYVSNLYTAVMGRDYDDAGYSHWVNTLNLKLKTRDEVFEGFVNSEEFNKICNDYGINCGTYKATDVTKPKTLPNYTNKTTNNSKQNVTTNKTYNGACVGNSRSYKFHRANAGCVNNMNDNNKVNFSNREDAIKAGYTPCGNCNP